MARNSSRPDAGGAYPRQREINNTLKGGLYERVREEITTKGKNHRQRHPVEDEDGTPMGISKGTIGVTAKQDRFAQYVAEGKSLSESYRLAYDAENMAKATIWQEASRTADLPHVAARVTYHVERIEREKPHDDAATRRLVRDYLVSVVGDTGAKTSDRTRAAELLGKVAGVALFSSKEEKPVDKPTSQAEFHSLLDSLKDLIKTQAVEAEEQSQFEARTTTETEDEGAGG